MRTFTLSILLLGLSFTQAQAQEAELDPEALPILSAHVEALGGRAALDEIKTIRTVTQTTFAGFDVIATRTEDRETGRFVNFTQFGNSLSNTGFDGEQVWVINSNQDGYLEPDDPVAQRLLRPRLNLANYHQGDVHFTRLPDSTLSQTPVYVLRSTRVSDPNDVNLHFIDQETHLPVQRYTPASDITLTYLSFVTIDGLVYPETTERQTPRQSGTTQLIEIEHNIELDSDAFEYPN
ncbi:MAG: hypothetical protein AAGI08_01200 [Bacteroidota bacterium]